MLQQQQPSPEVAAVRETPETAPREAEQVGGNAHAAAGVAAADPAAAPPPVVVAATVVTVEAGKTLRDLAQAAYGTPVFWPDLRDANPDAVFGGGAVFKVGDALNVPEKTLPQPLPDEATAPAGGDVAAFYPVRHNIDNGPVNVVYPDLYLRPLPASTSAEAHMLEATYQLLTTVRTMMASGLAAGVAGQVTQLMSYGITDWAITDAEATQAVTSLGALPIEGIRAAFGSLTPDTIQRLIVNLPPDQFDTPAWAKVTVARGRDAVLGPALDTTRMKLYFDLLPDGEINALQTLLSWRFETPFEGRDGASWDAAGLRRAWTILEQLPPAHVASNDMLEMILRDQAAGGAGYYDPSDESAVIGYGANLDETGSYGEILDGSGHDVGLGSNVNLFNTVLRHEIGHAVDAQIGASTGYAHTAENAGKWEEYPSKTAFADAVIAGGGGIGGHGYPDDDAYEKAVRKAIADETDFNVALQRLKDATEVPADVAEATATTPGPVLAVFEPGRWAASQNPWYSQPDRADVGGRLYQESYDGGGSYVSFVKAARAQYGVSSYQWRAPGEWFAEAYACYYSDHDLANGTTVGTRLRSRDPQTADWFDANVDNGFSLPAQTNQPVAPDAGVPPPGGVGGGVGGGP